MISCTEFIPAYSELFKYLEEKQGKAAVVDFWNYLSDKFLTNLKDLVVRNGIRGCWIYWSKTLKEEAADFTMELDEEAGEFSITMYHCPSKAGSLNANISNPITITASTAMCCIVEYWNRLDSNIIWIVRKQIRRVVVF